jgi:hypothetical protein
VSDWPFADPENLATLTVREIMCGEAWIHYVSRDADDGGWQFMSTNPPQELDAVLVSLGEIIALDRSVRELADLPLGWCAWRYNPKQPWKRARTTD